MKITKRKFLKWVSLGGSSLLIVFVGREVVKVQSTISKPTLIPTNDKVFGLPLWEFEFETVKVDKNGIIIEPKLKKQAKLFQENLDQNVNIEMVAIPGGKFLMGSPKDEAGRDDDAESPQHEVKVSPFFMGKYPVTQDQWRAVAALEQVNRPLQPNPSNFKGNNLPVEQVSWDDAVEFCNRLSKYTNRHYRLPSEAEWEYACRAGTTTPFCFGEALSSDLANYDGKTIFAEEPEGKYVGKTTPVGHYVANAFGLYDMHGNVREWCYDYWHDSYKGAPTDGSSWVNNITENDNKYRLVRGGSWSDFALNCRSAFRSRMEPDFKSLAFGFRVVVSASMK
ncbi:formylglycine-generating enzyme family protein [Nostoc sp. FACHB-280]|uniref:formylglycine-generating enzyme family protein n=1 Tax=Nostoc sp. FACHB-280 TaxID=2692839 RepID=UPI00168B0974|nr:formylglycine-generating enzyme family protein [Nostoc sp. FACHB-280]MBD2496358.1 formylglycine-generating enzyme family protein [Nostoc sp. FACHB-280]